MVTKNPPRDRQNPVVYSIRITPELLHEIKIEAVYEGITTADWLRREFERAAAKCRRSRMERQRREILGEGHVEGKEGE